MPASLEELKETASALSLPDRAELARHLLRTLEPDEEGAGAEWSAVAERRMAEVRTGRIAGVPAEQVLESLRRPRP